MNKAPIIKIQIKKLSFSEMSKQAEQKKIKTKILAPHIPLYCGPLFFIALSL